MSDARLLTIRQVSEYLFGDYTPSLRNRVYHIIEGNERVLCLRRQQLRPI